MIKYGLIVALAACAMPLNAEIYKWTDSDGNVHFSDKPHPGAVEVELPTVQTFSVPPVPQTPPEVSPKPKKKVDYAISIIAPQDQLTFRNPQGFVSVGVEVKPEFKPTDKVQIIFDGAPIGKPQSTTVFALRDINRGSHTIAAQLLDEKDKVLAESQSITIYMMQPRVGMGAAGRR